MTTLNTALKSRHISLIALGGMIGSAYFLGTGYILNQMGPCAFLAYILGGLITFLTMCCLAELSVTDPLEGSFISYAVKYISPSWGCAVGWSYWASWLVYIPSECIAAGILMHAFWPDVPVHYWAVLFGGAITLVNFLHVKVFGEMEFWLSSIKLFLLIGFSLFAILIFFGLLPSYSPTPIGGEYLFKQGGLFPNGFSIIFINMVILLANFQGSEVIGLAASESHEPLKYIPKVMRTVSYRIIGIYLVPIFLLALIFPWDASGLSHSVFADALAKYNLVIPAKIFSFLIIAGAISCANSGLYASIRSLYSLSTHRMAPAFLSKLSASKVPIWTSVITCGGMWFMLLFSFFFSSSSLYASLLSISGFTGSFCWICICISQYRMRKYRMHHHLPVSSIYHVKLFPFLTLFVIALQLLCFIILLLSPDLRITFYVGLPFMILPIIVYKYTKHRRPIL